MAHGPQDLPEIDVRERGASRDGEPQTMDRRLFMQLLAFECVDATPRSVAQELGAAFDERKIPGVIYEDLNHPSGLAVLAWSEDPLHFLDVVRPALGGTAAHALLPRPELTMIGRTYSSGFERDLEHWLIDRPQNTAANPEWPWAVWYPLRRKGGFERLEGREKGGILHEHATIGRAYGSKDLAHDVRLACHGLDESDNDFVIGLIGKDLYPLSHVVQSMRKTRQTSEYMEQMGPFFVGHVLWQRR